MSSYEEIYLKAYLDRESQEKFWDIKNNDSKTGVSYRTTEFLNAVAPNSDSPYIIFDTKINLYDEKTESLRFNNPMISLFRSFQDQNNSFLGNKANVISHNAKFGGQSEALTFFNNELRNRSGILVYTDYDGISLRINMIHAGMTFEQFELDSTGKYSIKDYSPTDISIAQFPKSFLIQSLQENKGNLEFQIYQENFQHVIEFITNTSIQSLFDSYFSIVYDDYSAMAGQIINAYHEKFSELRLLTDNFIKALENHKNNFLEQTSFVQRQKFLFQIKYINQLK